MRSHEQGLRKSIADCPEDIERQLQAIARVGLRDVGRSRLLTSSFLSIIRGVQVSGRFSRPPGVEMADQMIQALLDGLRLRN